MLITSVPANAQRGDGRRRRIPCHPLRRPPMPRVMPSLLSVMVQNSDFGRGEGETHWRIVVRDLGDVVIASNVYMD